MLSFVAGATTPQQPRKALAETAAAAAAPAPSGCPSPDPNLWPFGVVCGRDFDVPSPPESPSLVPTIATKTTTRLWGTDPFQEAVSVTQHIWPAALPENAPGETDNVPDRPWGITLVTADDPLQAISAVPLLHFPDDAPILFVTRTGIPTVTLNEIKRLGDTGIVRFNDVDAFLVGAAANDAVKRQLTAIGVKWTAVTGRTVFDLANNIDKLYGGIQNPDLGVPQMETSASTGGNGAQDVLIGSADGDDWRFYLPATHWASHMPAGLLWAHRNSVPGPTIDALKRRKGHALIYVYGGPDQISASVLRTLSQYGSVTRIDADDAVAFNTPATTTPVNLSVAFAKMWDPAGMMGWNILGPGHGFTLVNIDNWQGAVASAPLSHLGYHAPLLLTDNSGKLPTEVENYYKLVAPTFLTTPADGPYNMTFIIGDYSMLTWPLQAHVDFISEMSNRRVWSQSTGGRYGDGGN
ncbi:hypothetical protein ACFFWC_12680 [Plantactinospora siamensis]|uniref:Cell wall-binding repeat-containing protein n=1 Tax=Plantactinospora siamensis TaxID=555372 RepID=A0ABV6P1V5_9ACTN